MFNKEILRVSKIACSSCPLVRRIGIEKKKHSSRNSYFQAIGVVSHSSSSIISKRWIYHRPCSTPSFVRLTTNLLDSLLTLRLNTTQVIKWFDLDSCRWPHIRLIAYTHTHTDDNRDPKHRIFHQMEWIHAIRSERRHNRKRIEWKNRSQIIDNKRLRYIRMESNN